MTTFNHVKQTIVDAARDAGDSIVDAAQSARDAVVDAKDAVFDAAKNAKDTVVDAAIDAKDTVVDAATSAKDKTLDVAEDAKFAVTKIADTMTCAIIGDSKDDILDKLKADHETVAGFFDQLESTSSTSRALRADLFAQLKYELEAHSKAEEKTFYASLRGTEELVEAHIDHELVQQLLDDLAEKPTGSEAWMAQLRVLKENVQRHVQMEEDDLFVRARAQMTSATREDLGLRFQSLKEKDGGSDRGARGRQSQKRTPLKAKAGLRKLAKSLHLTAHR